MKKYGIFFELEYRDPRREGKRKHRHKCIKCEKIVNDGERVLMGRLRRKTMAMHTSCAGTLRPDGVSYTWGKWFEWLVRGKMVKGSQGGWLKETVEDFIKREGVDL